MRPRYAMKKVRAGDWLVHANDGVGLWRVRRYHENGSLVREVDGVDVPVVGEFWQVERWAGRTDPGLDRWLEVLATLDYDSDTFGHDWESYDGPFDTRAAAIEALPD